MISGFSQEEAKRYFNLDYGTNLKRNHTIWLHYFDKTRMLENRKVATELDEKTESVRY